MERRDHSRHCLAGHYISDLKRFRVRLTIVHTTAHIRVERKILHFEEKLSGTWRRQVGLGQAKIGQLGFALWSGSKNNLLNACSHKIRSKTVSLRAAAPR